MSKNELIFLKKLEKAKIKLPSSIYIAGGMTGVKNSERIFHRAELLLLCFGFALIDISNPWRFPHQVKGMVQGKDRFWFLKKDMEYLARSEYVLFLKNWKKSVGAKIEHKIAKALRLKIIHE